MSSIFSPPPLLQPGSGGKITLGRRISPTPPPYQRQESKSAKPGWIFSTARSIAAGAGKLFSAFRPDDSDSSSLDGSEFSGSDGSSYEDDESDNCELDDDNEDYDNCTCSEECEELNQVANKGTGKEPLPVAEAQKSETKFAVERLLSQETFTWEEYIRLTKVIQSRVVDSPAKKESEDATQKKNHDQSAGSANASMGGATLHAHMPDHCDTPIMEAKKWLQEKKLEQSSKSDRDHGPCTLNSAMLSNDDEGEAGSPAFMQSRPPCASASLFNVTYRTPPPIGLHLDEDQTQNADGLHLDEDQTQNAEVNHYFSTSKLLKRNSLQLGSCGTRDEIRRVRLKLTESSPGRLVFKQIDSSTRTLEMETSKTISVADKRVELGELTQNSNSALVARPVNQSGDLATELDIQNGCGDLAFWSVQNAAAADVPVTVVGDMSVEMNSRPKVKPSQKNRHTSSSDPDYATDHNGSPTSNSSIRTRSQTGKIVPVKDPLEHQFLPVQETFSVPDSRLQAVDNQMQNSNRISNKKQSSGSTKYPSRAKPGPRLSKKSSQNNSSMRHGAKGVGKSEKNCEPSSEAAMENQADRVEVVSENGKTKVSVLVRPSAATYTQRGRGRGRGRGKGK